MELRRALLLFAIVLGVAAIVTSISSPSERSRSHKPTTSAAPVAAPTPPSSAGAVSVRFGTERRVRTALVEAGRPAVVTVSVRSAGDVRLDGLGLTSAAEPLTPARFDVLPARAGRYRVLFTPAGERRPKTVGLLLVEPRR